MLIKLQMLSSIIFDLSNIHDIIQDEWSKIEISALSIRLSLRPYTKKVIRSIGAKYS